MSKLSSALVLNKFILHLFGVTDLQALSGDLKDSALEGYDENNVSHFYDRLIVRLYNNANLPKELLYQYDQNIFSHTRAISEKRREPIRWKYFQYLALLFTEIYLDRYFGDSEKLQQDLNEFLEKTFARDPEAMAGLPPYQVDASRNDLNKLAYWNATGSGKTLLMHVNILQYRHYLKKYGKANALNRIIVLTPNEGLSRQHLREFSESGMAAELFNKSAGSLFQGSYIEIIDIHKLEEKSGEKTVAVESFEGSNLVLVDEGHRGSGGESWKDKRNALCASGFSFEYSATFGQSVAAQAGAKQKALLNEYGKATLFDYSYRYFYKDGYGKDYQILNLAENRDAGYVELYLTACLLSFYEQLLVFREHSRDIATFLIEKPLAIFVGSKVTAVRTEGGKSVSDVTQVLAFIESFVKQPERSTHNIGRILNNQDGLVDARGQNIFRYAFKHLRKSGEPAVAIFNGLLKEVFNSEVAGARLHVVNLKGQEGEIGLRIGDGHYFGVINVGDDAKLMKLCEESGFVTEDKDFSSSLFHAINRKDSQINILIGSKRFSEGWSSWRVSTMGLLNIGRGEGSEIIQLFGRGVRLKGYTFSLKRSSALDYSIRPTGIPAVLPILETLNIFGIRADYMQQFKDYLEEEGLPEGDTDYEKITIRMMPTIDALASKNLKYIRVKGGANFKKEVQVETLKPEKNPAVILNWYPKIQVLRSAKDKVTNTVDGTEKGKLAAHHLAFFDWTEVYFELEKFKNERNWYNLNLSLEDVKAILLDASWYTLYIPGAELLPRDYSQVRVWQEIGVALLKSFLERVYNYEKQKYLSARIEVAVLDQTHPNFEEEYRLLIKQSEIGIINTIKKLKEEMQEGTFAKTCKISDDYEAIYSQQHLYYPLFYMDKGRYADTIKIQPVQLNEGERDFVEDLKDYCSGNPTLLRDQEVYLLRNLSRRGIGFFEANNFYPDFILWLVSPQKQHVVFVDPKGLRQIQGLTDPKIQLYNTLKTTIQPKLNDAGIELDSFIISNTPFGQISHWKGQESISDFNTNHVLFQPDQGKRYIEIMIKSLLVLGTPDLETVAAAP